MAKCYITLNGKKIEVLSGTTILENARRHGVKIPTLCNHESLVPYGACRLCIVEVTLNGRKQIVTSCSTMVKDGMKVKTDSPRIMKTRKTLVELLLARTPNAAVVQQLAREVGVRSTPFKKQDELCILCGQCVRTCAEIVGVNALCFINKGAQRRVGVPFYRDSKECIGCGSCVFVCPTGVVAMHDEAGSDPEKAERVMDKWETRLPLQKCISDGNVFATKRMLEHFSREYDVSDDFLQVCSHCRHKSKAQ